MNTNFSRFSTAALALALALTTSTLTPSTRAQEEIPFVESSTYNPDEELGSFDMVMQPYPIPATQTTYVSFFWNLPDDIPEQMHVIFGDVINSQPKHLHHFQLYGCDDRVDPSLEGLPYVDDIPGSDNPEAGKEQPLECNTLVGTWAPGALMFGISNTETGIFMGRAMGHQALRASVHYNDGVYADLETQTHKMATDGFRVHYTPNFRPYTTEALSMNELSALDSLSIPAGEDRFFVSKTCKVESGCKDITEAQLYLVYSQYWTADHLGPYGLSTEDMNTLLEGTTCTDFQSLCGNDELYQAGFFQQICPATCGLCDESTPEQVNPFNPESYRIDQVWYHAHLLGREMYSTLLREEDTGTTVRDLASQDFWNFDYQYHYPLVEYETVQNNKVVQGTDVKPGDKIQVTCVYSSKYEDEPTVFGLSTYEEMCHQYTYVTFETPDAASMETMAPGTLMTLMSFKCAEEDDDTNIYTGTLTDDEDGRDIWKDHPIEDAEGCHYGTVWIPQRGAFPTWETFNCSAVGEDEPMTETGGEDDEPIAETDGENEPIAETDGEDDEPIAETDGENEPIVETGGEDEPIAETDGEDTSTISAASNTLRRARIFALLSTAAAVLSTMAWWLSPGLQHK